MLASLASPTGPLHHASNPFLAGTLKAADIRGRASQQNWSGYDPGRFALELRSRIGLKVRVIDDVRCLRWICSVSALPHPVRATVRFNRLRSV